MVTSVGTLPSHDKNIFKLVYVAVIVYSIICFIGPFTGGHINPAISLGINWHNIKKKGQIKLILTYWIAQFVGGLLGVILSRAIYGNGNAAFA